MAEKQLDKNVRICYTYDKLSRVTLRTTVNYNTGETTDETFTYDAAGNIITTTDNCDTDSFSYDTNNRLTYHNGMSVTYDADGNMTSAYHDGSRDSFRYDSTNRLIGTNTNAYTYNAENVRIRNLCGEHETTYVYNTNAKLSSMLMKTIDGVVTKYIYGRGLIGEETNGSFKTYHFDYRGSTVAITDINGNVTDRFEYDTYGRLTSRTGGSDVIFLYNGLDGVVTDANGLIYMRARYYSPELRRFVNADILAGRIDNAVTLNRYAYANANPVSFVDPFGLSVDDRWKNDNTNGSIYTNPSVKSWYESKVSPNNSITSYRRLDSTLPTNSAPTTTAPAYYSVSWKSLGGKASSGSAYALGRLSAGNAYAGFIDKGLGVEAGVSGAAAEGELGLGNLSLDGEVSVLSAEANAEFLYEDGFKLGAEAKASVASAEASFSVDLYFFEIEIGANADFLSAGAEASIGASKNKKGEVEIGAEVGAGVGLLGFGFDVSLIF